MASPSVFGWNGPASDSLAAVSGRRWGIALRDPPPPTVRSRGRSGIGGRRRGQKVGHRQLIQIRPGSGMSAERLEALQGAIAK